MNGAEQIAAERERQVREEGWTTEHDDTHRNGSLAMAAACYAAEQPIFVEGPHPAGGRTFRDPWPWDGGDRRKVQSNFPNAIPTAKEKPAQRLRMLVKAGALIAAEIDRLQRATAPKDQEGPHV